MNPIAPAKAPLEALVAGSEDSIDWLAQGLAIEFAVAGGAQAGGDDDFHGVWVDGNEVEVKEGVNVGSQE